MGLPRTENRGRASGKAARRRVVRCDRTPSRCIWAAPHGLRRGSKEMSYSRFAVITSDLLVRKGEAMPSAITPPVPSLRVVPRAHDSQSPETLARQFGFAALAAALEDGRKSPHVMHESDIGAPISIFDRTAAQKSPAKAHKIMIALTSAE